MMATGTRKHKRIILSIEDKVKIIQLLDKSVSYSVIMENMGLGRVQCLISTKTERKSACEMVDMGKKKQAKVMKVNYDRRLDQAVFLWFTQKRSKGVPISGSLLCEKATELSKILQGEETNFKANEGWKWAFCKRHGIRKLSFQGEKLSAKKEAAEQFVPRFRKLVEEKLLSHNQVLTVMKRA